MSIIDVNHRDLRQVATAIETYCQAQDREMNIANSAITEMLSSDWQGQDAQAFGQNWAGVNTQGSVAVKFRDSLRNFAEALNASADLYERTQVNVFNSATRLMNFFGG